MSVEYFNLEVSLTMRCTMISMTQVWALGGLGGVLCISEWFMGYIWQNKFHMDLLSL